MQSVGRTSQGGSAIVVYVALLGLLVGAAAGGRMAFLKYFDANRLAAGIAAEIDDRFAVSTAFESAELKLSLSPALLLHAVSLSHPEDGTVLMEAQLAEIKFDFSAFIERRLRLQMLTVYEPEFYLTRLLDSRWNWASPGAASTDKKLFSNKRDEFTDKLLSFIHSVEIPLIRVDRGTLYYSDDTAEEPFLFKINQMKFDIVENAGAVSLTGLCGLWGNTYQDLFFEADFHARTKTLDLKISTREQEVMFEGELSGVNGSVLTHGRLDLHAFEIEKWLPASWREREHISGNMTAQLEVSFKGTHPAGIYDSLAVAGVLDVRGGSIRGLNLLKATISEVHDPEQEYRQLAFGALPDSMSHILEGEDTPFDVLQAEVSLVNGKVSMNYMRFKHPHYFLEMSGDVEIFDFEVDFRSKLVLREDLSAELIGVLSEMEALRNDYERIVLPFHFQGLLPGARPRADRDYLRAMNFGANGKDAVVVIKGAAAEALGGVA